jgi:broad specificity phosphatase PhoE
MQPFPGQGTFLLLRHGVTEWNVERRIMGRRAIPLCEAGMRQVAALVPLLADLRIAAVWTSPLRRARETAAIVAAALGDLPVHEEPGLTEVDYGDWEGRTFSEVVGEAVFRDILRDPLYTAPPGGERLLHVRDRVYAAMERVAREAAGAPALVVSHGDPLRLVLAGCLGLDPAGFRRLRLDNGGVSAIELTGDWAEVKFVNMQPDLGVALGEIRRAGARPETDVAAAPVQGGG